MARAEAEMAAKIQEAIIKQKIKEENMSVDIVERMKLIEVAEQEVSRRACELEAKVRKPSEGKQYSIYHTCASAGEARDLFFKPYISILTDYS